MLKGVKQFLTENKLSNTYITLSEDYQMMTVELGTEMRREMFKISFDLIAKDGEEHLLSLAKFKLGIKDA